MVYELQQRQVVMRVAVEVAAFEGSAVALDPLLEAQDLALLKRRRAQHPAGVAAMDALEFYSEELPDTETVGDRPRHEAVAGRNDRQVVPRPAVLLHQAYGLLSDHGLDA